MRSYGQFCPIARGSEIFAERWTPIILRNLLLGCRTFNQIAAGAPGLSRALLARRLRELERAGLVAIHPKPDGRGSHYEPTPAAEAMWPVLHALSDWAQEWTDLTTEHADPDAVLWSGGPVAPADRAAARAPGRGAVRLPQPGPAERVAARGAGRR